MQVLKNISGTQANSFVQAATKYSAIAAPAQNNHICFFCNKNGTLENNKKMSASDHSSGTLVSVNTQNPQLVRLMTKFIKSWGLYLLREKHLRFAI
ncbi:MAG: hypothetical protein K6L81_15450 [Agarilytica sp.]